MKTKNIFRMLLVAVALLLGANNVKADDIIWQGDATALNSQDGDRITISNEIASKIQAGDKIRVYGYVTNTSESSRGVWVNNYYNNSVVSIWKNWEEIFTNGVLDLEFTSSNISNLIIYDWQNNPLPPFINGTNVTITKIELISSGSSTPAGPATYTVTYTVDGETFATQEYTGGSTISMPAEPSKTGYTFDGWSGIPTDNIVNRNLTITANFTINSYYLIYKVDGEEIKRVAVEYNTTLYNLEGWPTQAGKTFSGWDLVTPFTMPANDVEVNGTFTTNKHFITYTVDGAEWKKVEVEYGTTIVPETYTPQEGYAFKGWGYYPETMPDRDITIEGSTSQYYNITLSYDETKGTATLSKTQSLGNEVIQLTVVPVEGYEVASVTITDGNGNVRNWGNYTFYISASNVSINITFKKAEAVVYYVSNYNNSQNGTVWADATQAEAGATVTLSNQPNAGYELDHYTVTDANNEAVEVTDGKFTMPAGNVVIGAVFKQVDYTVSISETTNGIVAADKTTAVHYGDQVTITVTPAEGYMLDALTVTDANNQRVNVNNYQFTMPAANVTIAATFKEIPAAQTDFNINLSYDGNMGNVSINSSTGTVGQTQLVYVTPYNGYDVSYISTSTGTAVNYSRDENGSSVYYFIMPEADVTLYIGFYRPTQYESVTVGSTGYASFSSTNALDFTNVSDVKAFIVKSVGNGFATLEQVTGTVAAGTGLILVGSSTSVPIADSGTTYSNNLLKAVLGATENVSGYNKYVLVQNGHSVKFAETGAQPAAVQSGHAYLETTAAGARLQFIEIDWNGDATAIEGVKAQYGEDDVIYNLRGQRVTNPTRGVYIINGKKVVIK